MFINIDENKRPKRAKIELARPNKTIIANIHEKFEPKLNLKLGNINELNFSIPYYVENKSNEMIKNENIEKIKELMYLKLTWGEYIEWFLVDNITESSSDNENMEIQAFSIGYELKRKKIDSYERTAINAVELFEEILEGTSWSVGDIDNSFKNLYRSFDEGKTDKFSLLTTGAETFGGVLVWDSINKTVGIKELDNIGEYKGFSVNYDRLMSGLNRKRTTDDIVTRLYVYGNEGLTIDNVNPTKQKYIEDYSYFLYPFERDADKNVIKHSDYMSDELAHALLDNKELAEEYTPQIQALQKDITNKNSQLSTAMIMLDDLKFSLASARGLLDIAKAVEDAQLIQQRKSEVANLEAQVSQQESVVVNLQSDIDDIQDEIVSLQNAISVRSFTQDLLDELDPFIIEKEIEDTRYIDEQELYTFGVSKFEEMREPKVVIETSLHGFLNSIEEQYYWDKLVLGDKMRVRQPRMNVDYKSTMIEMEVDLDTSDANVTIANFTNNVDEMDKFISILYSSENNSTILNNNKYKWDSVLDVRDEVTQLREAEIDATQKRITAGVNESVEIGERGIIITTPSFPNEMIIMQAGVIALSEDGGETWQTSIRPQGVVAETIIGKLIAGNNLVITNDSGSIVMDGDGLEIEADSIKIMSGGENPKNLVDDWNNMIINMEDFADDGIVTPYEKSQINHEWNMIADSHAKLIESFLNNMGVETPENPYPQEYDDYLLAYENLRKYLFVNLQSDGYALLNPDRMEENSPIDIGTYRMMVRSFTTTKDNFILVVPMEYANAYMQVLESSISLNYVKNDEVVAKINLSEEGTRIDGKLLEINSRTEFNHDLVMNAGLIQDANGDITIDLNKGEINLSKPLTINYVDVATKNDIDSIEMAYIASLSNDVGVIPTDTSGNNGDFSNAHTSIHVYQRDIDVTNQDWTFSATASTGVSGTMIGNDYTVTGMSVDSGYVDITAIKGSTSLTKRFSVSKARRGATGGSGDSAKVIRLSVDKEVMTFNNDNTANPSSQVVNIEAFLQGMTGSPTFTATAYNGTTSFGNVTTGFSGTGLKRTLTQSAFTENTTHITISATLSGLTDKISIVKIRNGATGQDGKDSIVGYLTNEAIVLPAHSDGVVSNYELAEGHFKVYEGLTEVSNQADYSEVFGDNITINLNTVTGQYVVTNMEDSQDEGYFDIKATYKGTEIIKRISVTKSKQGVKGEDGVDGLDAKILYLSATGESMTFNYDNTPNPASQTISFTAKLQNISGTATFTAIPYNGNTAMSAITLGGSGNTRTLTQSQFPSTATRIQITATLSGLSDTISIVKLRNGEKGFDGENSVVGYLTNENITVPATSSGVVSSSDLAKATGTFRVFDGLEEKTTDSSVVFSVTSEIGLDGEINSNGVYTVSAITANAGTLEMRATYKGISIYKTLTLVKARAGVNGVSVTNIDNEYAVNTSANTAPTSGWDSTMPSRTSGEFLWVREKITYSNGSVETTGTRMVTGDKGDNGLDGKSPLSVILLNENQSVATTSGRIATVAQTITIPFTAFVGINRVPATATVGTLPNGVTLSSNTAGTSTTDGVIVLSVAKNANLGGVTTAFDSGTIDITITADEVAVKKAFNWSKSISGANGTTARVFFVESDVSVIVRKEDGTHIPSSLTFYSYYKDGNTANKTAYARYWKIETTTDGGTWTTLATESTTMATTYKVNSIPLGIIGIRATTYSNTALTTSHDTQSVMIVSNGESGVSIEDVISEFAVNSSSTVAPTSGWQETQPNRNAGQYTWRRDRVFYSDNSETVTNPVVMTGDKGDSGDDAKLLFLTSTLENMIFNSDGSPNPSSQIATIEAKLQNVTGTVAFSAKAYNGTTALADSITLSGTGNSRTFSVANFPDNASHVTVTATIGNLTDNISIFKLRHGQKGDEGTSGLDAYTVVLSNESHAFVGDVSNALAGTTSFNVIAYKGATRVSSTIGTISGLPDGMSATLSNNGTATSGVNISVTTTMVSPNGTLTIPITVDGKVFTKNFSYSIAFKGTKGDTGQAGKGISSTVIDYQNHTSGTVVPSGSWNTTIPTPIKGQYLWTRTRTTYTDNSVIPTYSVAYNATDGQNGNDGKGINSTVVTYQLGASGTTAPKGTWLSEPPTPVQGQYLWTKTVINYTSGNPSISYSTSYHATDGQKGDKGDTGDSGADAKVVTVTPTAQIFAKNENNVITPSTITIDGSTQNTTISAWRYSVNGGSFGTTLPTGVTRSGNVVTITGSTMTARTIAVKALDSSGNADTTTIAKVQDGDKGDNSIVGYLTNESVTLGASSTGVVSSFATASGTFRVFDGTTEVTTNSACVFSLNSSTGVTLTINSSGVYTVTAMSADTATAEFKAVYKGITITKSLSLSKSRVGATGSQGPKGDTGPKGATGSQGPRGATGTSVSSVTEYYLATASSTGVTSTTSGWTTTIQTMTATNKYLWNYEKINFSDGTSQPTIPVIIGVYGDKGATGSTGATGRSITAIQEYYLATSASTGVTRSTSGWKTTMQTTTTTNKYLWNYEKITWSSGTTTTYVEPIIIGVHGDKGDKGDTGPRGATGSQGPRGNDGTSVSSIVEYYLATSASSGVTTSTSGWGTTLQPITATKKYLWNYEKINFSDGTSQNTIPVIIGVYGDKGEEGDVGRSITGIKEHYLVSASSSGVTRSTDGWKTTMQTTTETLKYLWNYETITWNKAPLTTYVEPIIIGVHGAKGATGSKGPQGVSPIVGFLTNESITLPASSAGAVPSFSGATGTFNVYQGTVLKNASADYSVVSQSGITVSITQSGVYTVTAMTTGTSVLSGTATLRAVYGGVTVDKILAVTKALAGTQGPTGGKGATGSAGQNATSYWINASVNAIKKDVSGNIVPNTITFSGFSKTGTSNPVAYSGRYIVQTSTNGTSYTTRYTSGSNQSSYTYTIPADAKFVKARLYLAGGTSVLLDEQTVPVLVDAEGIDYGGKTQEELNNLSHIYFSNDGYIEFPDEVKALIQGKTEATIEFWNKQDSYAYGFLQLSGYANTNGTIYPYGNETEVYLDTFRTNRLGRRFLPKPVTRWHHFAVTTHPADGWKLYQDGVLVTTETAQPTVDVSYLKFRIGNNSGNRYSMGGYRDIRLWDIARSNVDIISNMNTDLLGNESGLVGYWKVSENSGEIVRDLVNGNDGLIVNGVWKGNTAETDEKIGEKADQGNLDAVIGELNSMRETLDITIDENTFLAQNMLYEEWLTRVESSATVAESLAASLDLAVALIENNLQDQSHRWNTLDGFVQVDGATNTFTIKSNNSGTQMVLTDEALIFLSGGEVVATITNQYLEIARGIFTQSAQIGRHKFEPLASDKDHFTLSYVR